MVLIYIMMRKPDIKISGFFVGPRAVGADRKINYTPIPQILSIGKSYKN